MILAWHFVGVTLRDGAAIQPDSVWLHYGGICKMCESGLHASRDPFDALQYAPGSTLCLVEVDGIVEEQNDKLVCRSRRIVARMDATELLRYFARMQALSVIHLWDAPDVVLDYLMTDDEELRDAAMDAARAPAWAAARAPAWDAVRAAAWAAARAAPAWDAARDAAWDAARAEFNTYVLESFADVLPEGYAITKVEETK
jgi:hypothetical protein